MYYSVFTVEEHGIPNHIAIFVQTSEEESGTLYHVNGTIRAGMTYEKRASTNPKNSGSYVPNSKRLVGTVKKDDMGRFEEICESVPPPAAQVKLNGKLIDPTKPLRRCGEWVEEVIEKLIEKVVLIEPTRTPSTS